MNVFAAMMMIRMNYLREGAKSMRSENNVHNSRSEPELRAQALVNLRRLLLDKKPHIKEYYRIRKLHSKVISAMARYHEDGKFEQKIDATYVFPHEYKHKKDNTLELISCNFDFETQEGVHALYDLLIYKTAPNMNCITEEFIQKKRFRKAEKMDFLHSMLTSKLGLFEVSGVDPDEGYVYFKNVFTGDEYKITDVGLSGNVNFGEYYFYTRIITYHDISFNSGLNLIFAKSDSYIKQHIQHNKKNHRPEGEFLRFTQLYNYFSEDPDKVHFITNTLG